MEINDMTYPPLLFSEKRTLPVSPAETVTDLKLDLLLPEEVTRFLLLKSEKETLLARREMFESLLKDETALQKISGIKDALGRASVLYKAHNTTLSDKAAAYIFVHLFGEFAVFCRRASQMAGYGSLADRFAKVFRDICETQAFIDAETEHSAVLSVIDETATLVLKVEGENTKVARESEKSIADELRACAMELDVPLRKKENPPIIIQKDIAEAAGKLYPEQFAKAEQFADNYRTVISGEIFGYLEELTFIHGILKFTLKAKSKGIPYSFPTLSDKKHIEFKNVYDITLLKKEGTVIVPNDVSFTEAEPFYYLTGANGGGKTTYIRTVGVAVLLFLAGAPVFCDGGEGGLLDGVFTHFPRDERFEGSGRFFDEKKRVDAILEKENGNSLVLLNETFATTGEEKAVECTCELARRLYKSGSFGLYITHQHDVSENEIPFLGVMIDEADRNRRTYRIEKRRLPPRSFARDILEKYGLTKLGLRQKFGL